MVTATNMRECPRCGEVSDWHEWPLGCCTDCFERSRAESRKWEEKCENALAGKTWSELNNDEKWMALSSKAGKSVK